MAKHRVSGRAYHMSDKDRHLYKMYQLVKDVSLYLCMRWDECEFEHDCMEEIPQAMAAYAYNDMGSYQGVVCYNFIRFLDRIIFSSEFNRLHKQVPYVSKKLFDMQIAIHSNDFCLPGGYCRDFTNSVEWCNRLLQRFGVIDSSVDHYRVTQDKFGINGPSQTVTIDINVESNCESRSKEEHDGKSQCE